MAKRTVLNIRTGKQWEEEFEFVPPPLIEEVGPTMVRAKVVEMIQSATNLDDLKRALLLHLGELKLKPDGTLGEV
jgi:hypothetical protein